MLEWQLQRFSSMVSARFCQAGEHLSFFAWLDFYRSSKLDTPDFTFSSKPGSTFTLHLDLQSWSYIAHKISE